MKFGQRTLSKVFEFACSIYWRAFRVVLVVYPLTFCLVLFAISPSLEFVFSPLPPLEKFLSLGALIPGVVTWNPAVAAAAIVGSFQDLGKGLSLLWVCLVTVAVFFMSWHRKALCECYYRTRSTLQEFEEVGALIVGFAFVIFLIAKKIILPNNIDPLGVLIGCAVIVAAVSGRIIKLRLALNDMAIGNSLGLGFLTLTLLIALDYLLSWMFLATLCFWAILFVGPAFLVSIDAQLLANLRGFAVNHPFVASIPKFLADNITVTLTFLIVGPAAFLFILAHRVVPALAIRISLKLMKRS